MRHRKKLNHLSRTSAHRKAMLANMASSLILEKRITTTTAKAKALRIFVEPIITRSKEDSTHSRRMVFKHLRDKYAVSELFREVATKVSGRPGGYTRIIKVGNRQGDNADLCIIELVDYNENLLAEKTAATKPKSTRRRRGAKKKDTVEASTAVITEEADETEAEAEKTAGSVAEDMAAEAETPTEPETLTEPVAEEAGEREETAALASEETEEPAGEKPAEDEDKEEKTKNN